MSEYRRPSQGQMRGGVPMFLSGEAVDRQLAPKVQTPRRRFSMPDVVSELGDLLVDPTMRAIAVAAVAGAGIFAWLEWNDDTNTRTISSRNTPIERVVERPSVPGIPYTGEYSSTSVGKGMELEVDANAVVSGDVVVVVNGKEVPTFDNNSKTGELLLTDRPTRIIFPYGGLIEFTRPDDYNNLVAKRAEKMKQTGCVNGCEIVHIHQGVN